MYLPTEKYTSCYAMHMYRYTEKNVVNTTIKFGIKVENFRYNDSVYIPYITINVIKNRISY